MANFVFAVWLSRSLKNHTTVCPDFEHYVFENWTGVRTVCSVTQLVQPKILNTKMLSVQMIPVFRYPEFRTLLINFRTSQVNLGFVAQQMTHQTRNLDGLRWCEKQMFNQKMRTHKMQKIKEKMAKVTSFSDMSYRRRRFTLSVFQPPPPPPVQWGSEEWTSEQGIFICLLFRCL